jgi:hypothetical protein
VDGLGAVGLVIGGSPAVWEEFAAAQALVGDRAHEVIATNHAGRLFGGDIDAWVTLHPELFEPWREERARARLNTDYRALVYAGRKAVSGTEPYRQRWNGSSGLFAAQLALEVLGCAGVILCGVPLEREAGHFQTPGAWKMADHYREAALKAKAEGAPIRSISGWTADLFGRPDEEWLASLGLGPAQTKQRIRRAPEATMRIKMLKTHNFVPAEERRMAVKYLDGQEYTVKRAWGEAMVAEGVAKEVKSPPKPEADA